MSKEGVGKGKSNKDSGWGYVGNSMVMVDDRDRRVPDANTRGREVEGGYTVDA